MDPEHDPNAPLPIEPLPADADLVPSADPDAELAAAYAAWRLDRPEERP